MGFEPRNLLKIFKREGGESRLDIPAFAPIETTATTARKVIMLASVGGKFQGNKLKRWQLVGGQEYLVSPDLNDLLIVNGWAMGTLTREYSDDEVREIRAKNQNISVGSKGEVGRG